ncbi:hypothetical protein CO705_00240 [Ralstonia pickettii]|nr:hypothetical protein CO705_00240 [Ralstonia pickettii]
MGGVSHYSAIAAGSTRRPLSPEGAWFRAKREAKTVKHDGFWLGREAQTVSGDRFRPECEPQTVERDPLTLDHEA